MLSWLGVTELPEEHQKEGPSKATGRVLPLTTENEDALSFLGTCQQEQWAPLAGVTAHADLDSWADCRILLQETSHPLENPWPNTSHGACSSAHSRSPQPGTDPQSVWIRKAVALWQNCSWAFPITVHTSWIQAPGLPWGRQLPPT